MPDRNKIAIFICIASIIISSSASVTASEKDGDRIFEFAESLLAEGDYFRAIGEYKRFIFMYSSENGMLAEKATYRIAEAYYKAKRWSEAISACNLFLEKFPNSPIYYEVLYLRGKAEKNDNKLNESLNTLDIIVQAKVPYLSDKAHYQKAIYLLEKADWQGAQNIFLQISENSLYFNSARSFAAELNNIETIPHKSPVTSGVLAAILPGAGHLYTERYKDAVVSFLLNGAFIWGAVELFQDGNNVAGGIVSFFELGWYGGNIYSAVNSAHKYNKDQDNEFIEKIMNKYSISLYNSNNVSTIVLTRRF